MTAIQQGVAVITGAGSGIGKALAQELASGGCHLALSDIDADSVQAVADSLRDHDVRVTAHCVDVADKAAMTEYAAQIERCHGAASILINNAGVALSQTVDQMDTDDWEWLFGINWWGVVYGTHAFLPQLQSRSAAHIVNISSLFGLIGVPTQAAYCASKFAVRGYSESLRAELHDTGINVTTVHPGGVATNIARAARFTNGLHGASHADAVKQFDTLAATPPSSAARQIIAGIKRNKPRVVVGNDAKLLSTVERMMPSGYHRMVRRFLSNGPQ